MSDRGMLTFVDRDVAEQDSEHLEQSKSCRGRVICVLSPSMLMGMYK